jgi:hypothetical protein
MYFVRILVGRISNPSRWIAAEGRVRLNAFGLRYQLPHTVGTIPKTLTQVCTFRMTDTTGHDSPIYRSGSR